jgi:AcrR family transcriptional regulator
MTGFLVWGSYAGAAVTSQDQSSKDRRERRRLDPDTRRAEIVTAATRVFAARPYDQVALADIAEEAGASRALISHYFGDKAGVFAAVALTFAGRLASAVRTDRELPPDDMVLANIDAVLEFASHNTEVVLALIPTGSAGQDPRLHDVINVARDRVVDRIMVNHFGTADLPPQFRFSLRAFTGMFAVGAADWLRDPTLERRYVSEFLANTLLTIVADLRTQLPPAS